jgi:pyruvate formate-lyase activating enzyme-like uncharacterized protein
MVLGSLVLAMLLLSLRPADKYFVNNQYSQPSWGKLGERSVEATDNGMTSVDASNGSSVKAIKIKVKKGGINLHRCEVWFKNGTKKSIDLRNDVPAGSESREIDLSDKNNSVSKVVFWYDTRNYGKQNAEVELWGKS